MLRQEEKKKRTLHHLNSCVIAFLRIFRTSMNDGSQSNFVEIHFPRRVKASSETCGRMGCSCVVPHKRSDEGNTDGAHDRKASVRTQKTSGFPIPSIPRGPPPGT